MLFPKSVVKKLEESTAEFVSIAGYEHCFGIKERKAPYFIFRYCERHFRAWRVGEEQEVFCSQLNPFVHCDEMRVDYVKV